MTRTRTRTLTLTLTLTPTVTLTRCTLLFALDQLMLLSQAALVRLLLQFNSPPAPLAAPAREVQEPREVV